MKYDNDSKKNILVMVLTVIVLILSGLLLYTKIAGPKTAGTLLTGEKAEDKKNANNQKNVEKKSDNLNSNNETNLNNQNTNEENNNVNQNGNNIKKLNCPVANNIRKEFNGEGQSSGVTCPAGSHMEGDVTAKYVGKYTLKCVANSGYSFNTDCSIDWMITHSANQGTIVFHKNIPGDNGGLVKVYNKSIARGTFTIPDNWTRKGYVLSGWADTPNEKTARYVVANELATNYLKQGEIDYSHVYAVWKPINKTYGNVLFIGDSYVNSSEWPKQTAEMLGLNGSYTSVFMPGSGFINAAAGYGELGGNGKVNFSTLLSYSDKIIGDNTGVKKVVVAAGYNDYVYGYDELKRNILVFADAMKQIYPNATLYLAMVGTNFTDLNIESTLLNVTAKAFVDAANSRSYIEYIPYTGVSTSISDYLRWYGNYDGNRKNGCPNTSVSDSCYYWIESEVVGGKTLTHTMHPSKTSGKIIAEVISKYLKNH